MRTASNALPRYHPFLGLGRQEAGSGEPGDKDNNRREGENNRGDDGTEGIEKSSMLGKSWSQRQAEESARLVAASEANVLRQEAAVQAAKLTAEKIVKEAEEEAAKAKATGAGAYAGTLVGGTLLGPIGAKVGQWIGGYTDRKIAQENAINAVADKYGVEFGGDSTSENIGTGGNRNPGNNNMKNFDGDGRGNDQKTEQIVSAIIGTSKAQTISNAAIVAEPVQVAEPEKKDLGLPLLAGGILAVKLLLL